MPPQQPGIDLHTHTCHSDGMDTPTDLVAKAAQHGVRTLAVTDHDTITAFAEAQQAGIACGVKVVPGVELSVQYGPYDDIHVLGYGFDPSHATLQTQLARMQERRVQRGLEILACVNQRLTQRGKAPLDSAEVLQQAHGVLARPHVAQALIAHGYSSTVQNAFRDFLIPCNRPKAAFGPDEAFALMQESGGVCALAHPGTISSDPQEMHALLDAFKALGLIGIEVYHRSHYPHTIDFFQACATRYGLVATGGSDYHGRPTGAVPGEIAPGVAIPDVVKHGLQRLGL